MTFLNHTAHFMATKGCKSYNAAVRKIERVRGLTTEKHLMMVLARSTQGKPDDFVPVVILPKDTLSNPIFYAEHGLYVTNV